MDRKEEAQHEEKANHYSEEEREFLEALYGEDPEEERALQKAKKKRRNRVRALSLLLVVFFIGNFLSFWTGARTWPSIEFFLKSQKLLKEPQIKELKKAIVTIQAGSKKGTGFNISSDGLIVTNHHVVENAAAVYVRFEQGPLYRAKEIRTYPKVDLAIFKIEGKKLPRLELSPKNNLNIGSKVTILGHPLGLPMIVNQGQIIGTTRLAGWEESVLKIKAPIYQGSSGSPVFDQKGKVVAVIFATVSSEKRNKEEEIVALAIPVEQLKNKLLGM